MYDDVIPTIRNNRVLKTVKPTIGELLSLVPDVEHRYLKKIAQDILDKGPVIEPVISAEAFHSKCKEIHEYYTWQYFLIANTHDKDYEGYVKAMCDYMFVDEHISLDTPYSTYSEFIADKGLPAYQDQPPKVLRTIKEIYDTCTNYATNKYKELNYVQLKLIEVTLKLSSYSINMIRLINPNRIIPSGWSDIRIGNIKVHAILEHHDELLVDVEGSSGSCVNYSLTDVALADTNPETAKLVSYTRVELVPIEVKAGNFNSSTYIDDLVDVENSYGTGVTLYRADSNFLTISTIGVNINMGQMATVGTDVTTDDVVTLSAPAYTHVGAGTEDEYNRYLGGLSSSQLSQIVVI